jgi:Response regulator containing a CheY-like receiver domain and an HD-GYP domain
MSHSRGESLRKARRIAAVLQAFCIVLLLVLIFLFSLTVQRYSIYNDSIREDALWHTSQLDRAAHRLHEAVSITVASGGVSEDQVQEISTSFDLLFSQLDVMRSSIFGREYLAGMVAKEIEIVGGWVTDHLPVFDSIADGKRPSIAELERIGVELDELLASTTRLLSLTVGRVHDSRSESRLAMTELQVRIGTILAVLSISVTVLVVFFRRQLRVMNHAAVDLETISEELREANLKLSDRADWLKLEVDKALAALRERDLEIVDRLSLAASYKDAELGPHTRRVGAYSEAIARKLGLDEAVCSDIRLASPMHDIGKVAIPDAVLLKSGPLTDAEFIEMQTHTVIGSEILSESKSPLLQLAAEIAEHHHEYWNGAGYPHGLSGDAIPLSARIVAVADTFDALTTIRPYKAAWSTESAIEYIIGRTGTQFDPDCVDAFRNAVPELLAVMDQEMADIAPAANSYAS